LPLPSKPEIEIIFTKVYKVHKVLKVHKVFLYLLYKLYNFITFYYLVHYYCHWLHFGDNMCDAVGFNSFDHFINIFIFGAVLVDDD